MFNNRMVTSKTKLTAFKKKKAAVALIHENQAQKNKLLQSSAGEKASNKKASRSAMEQ